jgi:DNA-binding winged helix-turn-helix (wHTH) protein
MKYVRDKVDGPGEPRLIHTIRGIGYELREDWGMTSTKLDPSQWAASA